MKPTKLLLATALTVCLVSVSATSIIHQGGNTSSGIDPCRYLYFFGASGEFLKWDNHEQVSLEHWFGQPRMVAVIAFQGALMRLVATVSRKSQGGFAFAPVRSHNACPVARRVFSPNLKTWSHLQEASLCTASRASSPRFRGV